MFSFIAGFIVALVLVQLYPPIATIGKVIVTKGRAILKNV